MCLRWRGWGRRMGFTMAQCSALSPHSLSESWSRSEPQSCWASQHLCSRGPGRHCCQILILFVCGVHLTFIVMPTAVLLWNQERELSSFGETKRKFQRLRHSHLILWAAKRQPAPISVFKSFLQLLKGTAMASPQHKESLQMPSSDKTIEGQCPGDLTVLRQNQYPRISRRLLHLWFQCGKL